MITRVFVVLVALFVLQLAVAWVLTHFTLAIIVSALAVVALIRQRSHEVR